MDVRAPGQGRESVSVATHELADTDAAIVSLSRNTTASALIYNEFCANSALQILEEVGNPLEPGRTLG